MSSVSTINKAGRHLRLSIGVLLYMRIRQTFERTDGREVGVATEGQMDEGTEGLRDRGIEGRRGGATEGQMDESTEGQRDGGTDGRMDGGVEG